MKTSDDFGRDYTAYVSQKAKDEEPQIKRKDKKASQKPNKKYGKIHADEVMEDLPF
jgi:hypothetical protein